MRYLTRAAVGIGLTVAVSRLAFSEPPPALEPRDVSVIIAALSRAPGDKASLASVRWYAEVAHGKTLQVPVGSAATSLGPWSDNGALLASEDELSARDCAPLSESPRKAATALLAEFGDKLPPVLHAYALMQDGKSAAAAAQLTPFIEAQLPGSCPSEHPMYSSRRVARMSMALRCLERAEPGRDHAKLKLLLERATVCGFNNHAVG